jgi:ribose 5-phosphate isomerase A
MAAQKAINAEIPLTTLEENLIIDLTIDGADEIDTQLNLIKGGGGALLHERIVAQASRREIIIVDDSKVSPVLGTRKPVPVEVIPFGWAPEAAFIENLGARVALRKKKDGDIFMTEEGNYILDCHFGPIDRIPELCDWLESRPGIVAYGLWSGIATDIIIAGERGMRHLRS